MHQEEKSNKMSWGLHTLWLNRCSSSRKAQPTSRSTLPRGGILYGQSQNMWRRDLTGRISEAIAKVVKDYGLTVQPGDPPI